MVSDVSILGFNATKLNELFKDQSFRDRYIPLWYTNYKDKNDKEIYEADILMYPDKRKKIKVVVRYGIRYCEEYGTYVGFNIPEDFKNMVVVGYENPELLEGDKNG